MYFTKKSKSDYYDYRRVNVLLSAIVSSLAAVALKHRPLASRYFRINMTSDTHHFVRVCILEQVRKYEHLGK